MSKSVVIVDDSNFILKNIQSFMEDEMGFKVLGTGKNGIEAVELYTKHKPDFITLDITMPEMDGFQALKEIRSYDPEAKVVMVSAVRSSTFTECFKEGACAFIEKPLKFQNKDFVENTKEVLEEIFEKE